MPIGHRSVLHRQDDQCLQFTNIVLECDGSSPDVSSVYESLSTSNGAMRPSESAAAG
jgi:hypothetical protein